MRTLYQCEICRATYATAAKAMVCEARGVERDIPAGTIVGNSVCGYSAGIVFAVTGSEISCGHFRDVFAYACRDTGYGDTLDDTCSLRGIDPYAPARVNAAAPAFRRMIEALIAKGLEPRVWDGSKAIPLAQAAHLIVGNLPADKEA